MGEPLFVAPSKLTLTTKEVRLGEFGGGGEYGGEEWEVREADVRVRVSPKK